MPLVPFNSVGGYSTGRTGYSIILESGLVDALAGISSAGGTFSSNIRLQNAEYIQNTTNGRMDFMPAPGGSTHYGMYLDFTSWGYGPRFGTIRSSDNATNTTGILWDAQLNLSNNVRFNFSSDGQNGVVLSDTGNNTIQFFTNVTSGTNSGAVAIVDSAGVNTANRAPGVTHTNPNLYVYRAGSARATDFIRLEHDGTNGEIVSGGTSGISLEPGSGVVGISGGINAAGATFTSTVTVDGSNVLNAGNIQTTKAALEIDTARSASRVAIGDINGLGNGNYIYLRNATNELNLASPYGYIKIGDVDAVDTGNYIYYAADEHILHGNAGNIFNFNNIYANVAFYETANAIRVTNNARSWFL